MQLVGCGQDGEGLTEVNDDKKKNQHKRGKGGARSGKRHTVFMSEASVTEEAGVSCFKLGAQRLRTGICSVCFMIYSNLPWFPNVSCNRSIDRRMVCIPRNARHHDISLP